MCKKCTLLSFSNSPSLKTLLMCLVITERSLWNSDEICACVSHTVSSSTRTSSRMVSSGWYITISPLLPDSMLCILSNLEFNILVGDKGNTNIWIVQRKNIKFAFSSVFPCHLERSLPVMSSVVERSALPLGLSKTSPTPPCHIEPPPCHLERSREISAACRLRQKAHL